MKINFLQETAHENAPIIVGIFEGNEFSSAAQRTNDTTNNTIERTLKNEKFSGKMGEVINFVTSHDVKAHRIIILGLGKKDDVTELKLQQLGKLAYKSLDNTKAEHAVFHLDNLSFNSISNGEVAAHIAFGALKGSWRFEKYKTTTTELEKDYLQEFSVVTEHSKEACSNFSALEHLANGIALTKDLGAEPGNKLYPESYAEIIKDELKSVNIDIEILNEKDMQKLGMECLLGVAQGSEKKPRLVIMKWNGGSNDQQPVAFVGKGVTFDAGGICIKPTMRMDEMKYDMAGSSAVVGLMKTIASRKAKINALGVVALAENMPSGSALKPGDVLTSISGKTVEILNTDAEGRLILADALWYTQDRFKPQFMINLATLTGAIISAVGHEYAGLFSNNDNLSEQLLASGIKTGEKLWRFPLGEAYQKLMNSHIADINHCPMTREAGSIIGGQFLQNFVNEVPWAHLDIAGTGWDKSIKKSSEGPTGFGVSILNKFLQDYYEV